MKRDAFKGVMHNRIRYKASIAEAFAESQAVCRIQLSFYFAFSLIVSQKDWKKADCMIKNVFDDGNGYFTISLDKLSLDFTTWFGLPILLASSIMSVISISMAQFSMYRTRHNYEMSFLGRISYTFR